MAKVLNVTTGEWTDNNLNSKMNDAVIKVVPDGDMCYVTLESSVTGNKTAEMRTGGDGGNKATGSSVRKHYGSDYAVADTTIPFTFDFCRNNERVMEAVATIQRKESVNISAIQGQLTEVQESALRTIALKSQAIREARQELERNEDSLDSECFDRAVSGVKARAYSDMSLRGAIVSTAAIGAGSPNASFALDKGYKRVKGKDIYFDRQEEAGLKKVYLMDKDAIKRAQAHVWEVYIVLKDAIEKNLVGDWSNEVSLKILEEVAAALPGNPDGDAKEIPNFSAGELAEIAELKRHILKEYGEAVEL